MKLHALLISCLPLLVVAANAATPIARLMRASRDAALSRSLRVRLVDSSLAKAWGWRRQQS